MGFRENLRQKIRIDRLAAAVIRSMGAPDSGQRADLDVMRQLIDLGHFEFRRERDLDLYLMDDVDGRPQVLVLDNELKIFTTTVDDIALRKSPTIKEMVSIRNAIKILNDKDVVVTRKADTVEKIRQSLIDRLDLAHTAKDIEALAKDGQDALNNNYVDGLMETMELFAELLDYRKAPKAFQVAHHRIWGRIKKKGGDGVTLGPVVLLNLMQNSLKMFQAEVNSRNKGDMSKFHQVAKGEHEADITGAEVFSVLQDAVMQKGT